MIWTRRLAIGLIALAGLVALSGRVFQVSKTWLDANPCLQAT